MQILFYAPEYRPNLSNMIRTAEFYGLKKVYIFDKNKLLSPPNNKVSRSEMEHMARVWTAGAIEHINIESISDVEQFIKNNPGRAVATLVNDRATALADFAFEKNDLIIMGSEKNGLPPAIEAMCQQAIYIPQVGHTNCLNVSVCFGIILNRALENGS
jgi:tRNA G18 (ribose-2'-O)-methylase SpoU